MSALDEERMAIAQANAVLDKDGRFVDERISARKQGEFEMIPPEEVDMMDVSPNQLVSVAASLIPVPRERRRESRPDGLEHDAAGRPAAPHERSARGDRHGSGRGARFRRDGRRQARRHRRVGRRGAHRVEARRGRRHGQQRRHHQPDQVPALEPEHLHQPAADRQGGRPGQEGAGDRGRSGDGSRRDGARRERDRRVHAVGWVQLRGLDPHLRAHRQGRLLHFDPHRRVRVRRPRHEARQGRHHPRHPQRRRGSTARPRRGGHRPHRCRGPSGRHPGRQDHAEGRDPALARGAPAARDLRREGGRRARHVAARSAGRHGHDHRRPGLLPPRRREGRARQGPRRGRDRALAQGSGRRDPDHPQERLQQGARADRRASRPRIAWPTSARTSSG